MSEIEGPIIAMIDDEIDFLEITNSIISSAGYTTMCTTDSEVFMEYFQKHEIALAILDVEMPEKNGFEISKELRDGGAELNMPVIFLTGRKDAGDQLQGFFNGANEYLFKPVDRQELLATVKRLIN